MTGSRQTPPDRKGPGVLFSGTRRQTPPSSRGENRWCIPAGGHRPPLQRTIDHRCHCEAPKGPWQSHGSNGRNVSAERYFPEIATSASPPRNDMGKSKPRRRPSTTAVIARPHRGRGNLMAATGGRFQMNDTSLRLPRRLRLLAMTWGNRSPGADHRPRLSLRGPVGAVAIRTPYRHFYPAAQLQARAREGSFFVEDDCLQEDGLPRRPAASSQ